MTTTTAFIQTAATAAADTHLNVRTAAQQAAMPTSLSARAGSLAMAAVLTLAMLAGVNTLAVGDNTGAPQLAQIGMLHA